MNGDSLIPRVREILKDVATDVAQGEFWADREIILALNAAQAIFVNFALETKQHYLLAGLVAATTYRQGDDNFEFDPPYLHYISAQVGEYDKLKPAKIYLGAEAITYEYTRHKGMYLVNNDMFYLDGLLDIPRQGWGIFYYYQQPSYIGATSLGDNPRQPLPLVVPRVDFFNYDFEEYIYNEVFTNHAAVICGLKETTNQRDFKKNKRYLTDIIMNPPIYANFVNETEFTGLVGAGRPQETPQSQPQN